MKSAGIDTGVKPEAILTRKGSNVKAVDSAGSALKDSNLNVEVNRTTVSKMYQIFRKLDTDKTGSMSLNEFVT